MESNKAFTNLVEEVQSYVDILQKAIAAVGQVKKSLKTTASDVNSQIRDSVSRHLEAMRNREIWLLAQVEVVQHIKEDVLRQQQAELNRALGRLQSTCSMLEQGGKTLDRESLEYRTRESLSALSDLNLTPEETNTISFLARNFQLQESIHKFGVVASDNLLFNKQAEPYRKKTTFYSPPGSSSDWLMKNTCDNSLPDVPEMHSAKIDIQNWLPKQGTVTTTTDGTMASIPENPIEHWLVKSQSQDIAMETENGKQALNTKEVDVDKEAEIQGWLLQSRKNCGAAPAPSSGLFEYYQVISLSDSSKWLKTTGTSTIQQSSTNPISATYRKIAASSSSQWLMKKPSLASKLLRNNSTQSCSECSCGIPSLCSESSSQEELTELEDDSSETSDWLMLRKEDSKAIGGFNTSSKSMLVEPPDNDKWLLTRSNSQSSVVTNDTSGIGSYKENVAAQSNQHWLQRQGSSLLDNKEADEAAGSSVKSFSRGQTGDFHQWLLKPTRDSGICKWLARSSSEKCKNCPRMCSKGVFKVFDQVAGSKDGWLMSTQELY